VSENPVLDKLWASLDDDFKEVTDSDKVVLKELQKENLIGCIKFIKVCFSISLMF
jgi:hypothetical protein